MATLRIVIPTNLCHHPPPLPAKESKSKFKIISIHFRTQSIQHMALGTEEYTAGTWPEVVILMMMVVVVSERDGKSNKNSRDKFLTKKISAQK